MRNIKFKAKTKSSGMWLVGVPDNDITYPGQAVIHSESGIFDIDPETVCQFTGLHDIDGKEIYEGDILGDDRCCTNGIFHIIVWMDGEAAFCQQQFNTNECPDIKYQETPTEIKLSTEIPSVLPQFVNQRWIYDCRMHVVGNIHNESVEMLHRRLQN